MTVRRWAGTSCSPRAVPGGPPGRRGQHAGCPYRPGDAGGGCRRASTGTPAGNAGRHESSKVRAVVTTTRRSPLIRWSPQLAASQISAATRIATKNTTTMTAAGIVRSLWSCLCKSVPLAVDGARARRGRQAWSRCAGGFGCPGCACTCRTYACSIRRCVAEPTLVRSGVAPRALWGEVPGDPTGPACRTARRGWLGPGRRGLLPR